MRDKKNYHVVPSSKGGWDVKRGGSQRASGHFDTKTPAMSRARELAQKAGVERVEHKRDGKIRDSDSYGNDPCPPRDRVR
ncbi:hypothetical protein FP2506_05851 [Fulvimarina pelagi HTCC2506]|uniref:DUF2188 domain-containing protein n=1 Tax=Fulvimarina pelagi HTCC2506 TaxID=314231 RepID=Q0G7M6_9HYPH|nr:DUF2188 domain-containing protein [Fulvimarina pelagi]EAU42338.1 hypothetical protein FP2506_05851 [Fulvimarina pelagi HTCC2506]